MRIETGGFQGDDFAGLLNEMLEEEEVLELAKAIMEHLLGPEPLELFGSNKDKIKIIVETSKEKYKILLNGNYRTCTSSDIDENDPIRVICSVLGNALNIALLKEHINLEKEEMEDKTDEVAELMLQNFRAVVDDNIEEVDGD